jgi:uncharacterized membrane protein YGL010W
MTKDQSKQQPTTPGLIVAHALSLIVSYIIIDAALKFENAGDALAFYGVYHREPWNQFIHFFGVPGILWSLLIFFVHLKVPILGDAFQKIFPDLELTYGLIMTLFYGIFYLQLDAMGGILYAPILYVYYTSAVYLTKRDQSVAGGSSWSGTGKLLTGAFVLHVLSWYVQIHLGHHVIEGAQPASLQSLGGALTVAPLFAFYEGMWMVGINKALQNTTLALVDQYTQEICEAGKISMRVCESLLTKAQ